MPTRSPVTLVRRALCLAALAGLALATPASAAFTSNQQKCVNTFNKEFRKVVKTVGKDYCSCLKDGAKGKLEAQTVTECFDADRKGKQAGAATKAAEKFAGACAGGNNPGVSLTDPATAFAEAITKEQKVFAAMFGPDIDAAVVLETADKNASLCQQAVAKSMEKCQDTKINEFLKCKRDAMKLGRSSESGSRS
jgi:hypothetical protein